MAKLSQYADLLDLWSPKVNLLSCGSALELVDRHLLDSLAVAAVLPESGSIVDLGSGAGFPGIPLAILRPDQSFVLVEVRRRRATFLREVRRTLGLGNVEILEQRAETPPTANAKSAEAVVTRAVWSDESLLEIAARWLSGTGRLFWMRSDPWTGEMTDGVGRERIQYQVGQGRLRTVEILRLDPSSSECST
ncbi:MAG: 16S rRNA (guanine(527)-N(7))-methyltransferase RsmG [Candidatus Binatia bacterium]